MSLLEKIVRKGKNLYRREVLRDGPLLEAKRWFRDDGDNNLRLNYDLNSDSVVVDIGGYIGDFAQQIHDRYGASVYLFEPVPAFHARCVQRFGSTPKVHSFCYGLGSTAGVFQISDDADASSFFAKGKGGQIDAEVRSIAEVLEKLAISRIDLLKINIEGGEYDVLPALIRSGWIPRIRNIQVQFHTVGDDYEGARNSIRDELAKTHRETWCYKFVWENWERTQSSP